MRITHTSPDSERLYTPEQMETDLFFAFKGPGLYLTASETFVVIPVPPKEAPDAATFWGVKQPEGTQYSVQVYNCRFEQTMLAVLAKIPSRN